MKKDVKLMDILLWPVLVLFLLASLLAALRWYMTLDLGNFSLSDFSLDYLLLAAAFHIVGLFLVIVAWHRNLQLHGVKGLTLLQSITMIGVSVIGKYTPGKIWGMVARGAILHRLSQKRGKVVQTTVTEQVALLHSGMIVASLTFLGGHEYYMALLLALPAAIATVWWVSLGGDWVLRVVHYLGRKNMDSAVFENTEFKRSYPTVCGLLTAMWLFVGIALLFCTKSYAPDAGPRAFQAIYITVLAYLGGFAAVFSIAGLGVRDGIMVAALSPYLGVTAALYVSVLHRLMTALFDVVLGLLSLFQLNTGTAKDEN